MNRIQVFEPTLCCAPDVCHDDVDQALVTSRCASRPLRSATSEANLQRAGITGIRPNSADRTATWDALPRPCVGRTCYEPLASTHPDTQGCTERKFTWQLENSARSLLTLTTYRRGSASGPPSPDSMCSSTHGKVSTRASEPRERGQSSYNWSRRRRPNSRTELTSTSR